MSARVTMERRLFLAIQEENEETVRRILAENPNVNVNWENEGRFYHGWTALHKAIAEGYDRIVSLLLAHSEINVNQRDSDDVHGQTPFHWACFSGMTSCARLLLEDARVGNLNEPNNEGYTPLWNAASGGYLDVIKWWIASGRDMDLGQPGNERTDAIGGAKIAGKTEVVALFERFKEKPVATRHHLRVELGMIDEMAAEMFALVVFVSDGLLQISQTSTPASQFFTIASQLPLELQMVLCSRVAGSVEEMILTNNSEVAFKALATKCWFA